MWDTADTDKFLFLSLGSGGCLAHDLMGVMTYQRRALFLSPRRDAGEMTMDSRASLFNSVTLRVNQLMEETKADKWDWGSHHMGAHLSI